MTRKSKQSGGNFPLTHYERTKKFASSEHGTTSKRIAGHSQYQLGDCALSLTKLGETALCSPSGYLYSSDAILEYLLTKTQQIKEQQVAYEQQQQAAGDEEDEREDGTASSKKKRSSVAAFEETQKVVKKSKMVDSRKVAQGDLKRTSYWLSDSQPDRVDREIEKPPERPPSPHSQTPLRRKDLWKVRLNWEDDKLVCAVSGKALKSSEVVAYWTDKKGADDGQIVLKSVYDELIVQQEGGNDGGGGKMRCPNSSRKVRHTRPLQRSGTSFSSSGQQVRVQKYNPILY